MGNNTSVTACRDFMKFLIPGLVYLSIAVVGSAGGQTPAPLTEGEYLRIDASPAKGFNYPYFLYVPPELKDDAAKNAVQTLLVTPNNTGKVDDDFAVHEADAKLRISISGPGASLLKVAVLVPAFPRPQSDWRTYTHALDRDSMLTDNRENRRLDLQLIAMIDDARRRLAKGKLRFDRRVLMNGFSAQGMFVNRFTFLHPDRVKAAAIGSPGGWPIAPAKKYQDKTLRYPIGVADLKTITGKDLDLKALRRVPLFIFIGSADENDSVPFDDSYDEEDRVLIYPLFGKMPVDRWPVSQMLYEQAGLNATFKIYPGVVHTVSQEERDDIRSFLLKNK